LRAFAELLDRLSLTSSRNAKLVLLRDYLKATPDPDRGWALAALTGEPELRCGQAGDDPAGGRGAGGFGVLFGWSYDYVGDLAETVALIWPGDPDRRPNREPELGEVVDALAAAKRNEVAGADRGLAGRAGAQGALGAAEAGHRGAAGRHVGAAGQDGGGDDPARCR
jgi:DNA ligase-1